MAAAKWHCFSDESDPDTAAPPRTQNKITKPRTNNNSTSALLQVNTHGPYRASASAPRPPPKDAPANRSSIIEIGSGKASGAGDRASRQIARRSLKDPVCGINGEDPAASIESDDDGTDVAGVSNKSSIALSGLVTEMKKRLSRPASQKSLPQLPSATASTTLLSSNPSRYSLAVEAIQVPEETLQDGEGNNPASSSEPAPPSKRDSLPPSLVRRRTMLVPGVATRGQPRDVLRKPPPPDAILTHADREYYYNPSYPETSPLTLLASLNQRCPSLTSQRAMTPSDLDYSHLHGFLRGSLRITNGAASPAPSVDTQQGYFPPLSKLNVMERTGSPLADRAEEPGQPRGHKPASSLQLTVDLAFARSAAASLSQLGHAETRTAIDATSIFDDDSVAGFETPAKPMLELTLATPMTQPTTDDASRLAQDYQNEIMESPVSVAEASAGLDNADKMQPTAQANDFHDEGVMMTPPHSNPHSWSVESEGHSYAPQIEACITTPHSAADIDSNFSRSSSLESDKFLTDRRRMKSKALSKSDSGYGSHVSLRSLDKGPYADDRNSVSRETTPGASASENPRELPVPSRCEPSRPPPPPPAAPAEDVAEGDAQGPLAQEAEQSHRLSMPAIKFTDPHGERDTTKDSGPFPPQRKLQKSRRQSQSSLPVPRPCDPSDIRVVTYREIDGEQIPPIPAEAVASLAERLRMFPALDHTYLTLEHTSLSDDEACSRVHQRRDDRSSQLLSDDRPSFHRSITRYNAERRNSARYSVADDVTEIVTDFGTVAESLGASPYDAAMQATGRAPSIRRSNTQSPSAWHPHQIGVSSTTARPPNTGMDEESATALARRKSKDYLFRGDDRQSRPRSLGYEDQLRCSPSPRRGPPRPKSMVAGLTPPVPALPRIKEQRSSASLMAAMAHQSPAAPGSGYRRSSPARQASARRETSSASLLQRPSPSFFQSPSLAFHPTHLKHANATPRTGRNTGRLSYSHESGYGLDESAGMRQDQARREGIMIN